jgi:alpha-L-rhamnosidase
VLIAPEPGSLVEATASFLGPTGRISSRWSVKEGRFHLEAEIPPGVSAQLIGPDGTRKEVEAGRHTLDCSVR